MYFSIEKTAAFIATVVAVDCGASSIKNKERQVNSTTGVLCDPSKAVTKTNNKGFFNFDYYVFNTEHILYLPVYCLLTVVIQLHALTESNLSKEL